MSDWAAVLMSALDEVEYGIVVLDKDFQARFVNRAFQHMWALPEHRPGVPYSSAEIVEHIRKIDIYDDGHATMSNVIEQREFIRDGHRPPMQLRLADGRVLKFECKALSDGGRMLTYADISDLVHTADQMRELATLDDLTKLLNRRQFLASFGDELTRAQRHDRQMAVLMVDIDFFKRVNDRHGHSAGDEVLRGVAGRFHAAVRQGDIVGRVGGEEFAAVLVETDMPDAVQAAERVCRGVAARPFEAGEEKIPVTVSVGVAARQAKNTDTGELLRVADAALYAAKAAGRNRVIVDIGDPNADTPTLTAS
jgi:diguanylate cyclase (GGDEF)-like protein